MSSLLTRVGFGGEWFLGYGAGGEIVWFFPFCLRVNRKWLMHHYLTCSWQSLIGQFSATQICFTPSWGWPWPCALCKEALRRAVMMWLLSIFFLATVFSCTCPAHPAACTFTSGKGDALLSQLLYFFSFIVTGGSPQVLQQTPISITKPQGKTAQINCHVSSSDFSNVLIHWYQKKVNAAPKRVAYMSSKFFLENKSDEGKFTGKKDPSKSVCILTVNKVTPQDSATYYCASWDAQQ